MTATDDQQDWDACPAGELTKMVQARSAQRRRKTVDRLAVVAAGALVCLAIGGFTLGLFTPEPDAGGRHGDLACSEVLPLLPGYIEGEIDDDQQRRVAAHLEHCPGCKSRYEQMMQQVSQAAYSAILFAAAGI